MKKHLLTLVLAFFIFNCSFGQVVDRSFPLGDYSEQYFGAAADPMGNIYVGGGFQSFQNPNNPEVHLLRKLDQNGAILWAVNAQPNYIQIKQLKTDLAGNCYVLGAFSNTMQLPGGPVHTGAFAGGNLFLAKYNPAGVLQWSVPITGNGFYHHSYFGTDALGNIVLAGYNTMSDPGVTYSISLGNGLSVTSPIGFIAGFSSAGVAQWGTAIGGQIVGLSVTPAGEAAITGNFNGVFSIGTTNYPSPVNGIFTAKFNATGGLLWQNRMAVLSSGVKVAAAITADAGGAVFIAGKYSSANNSFNSVVLPQPATWNNAFVLKFNSTGTQEWAKHIAQADTNSMIAPKALATDANGNVLIAGNYEGDISIQGNIFGSYGFGTDVFLFSLDANGTYNWGIKAGESTAGYSEEYAETLTVDAQDNIYLTGSLPYTFGPIYRNITFGNYTSVEVSSFLYRIKNGNVNRISGRVFYDFNSNGIKDGADIYAAGAITQFQPGGFYSAAATNGQYTSYVETGTFTITIPNPPVYYTAVPASHTVTFTTTGNVDTTRHFALQPVPGMQDLEVTISPTFSPRPGFDYPVKVTYKNVGTVTVSGSLVVTLDPVLTLQNSSPAATSQAGNTLTWAFNNLQPTQSVSVMVNTVVPATTVLGTTVLTSAQLMPLAGDQTPANNSATVNATVVGSFDPNDKQASQNWLTPTEVAAGKYLEYTIRFQNTGTDTAFTVRLLDTLDAQLNIPTFELLASSHSSTWSIKGNGILEWQFNNILLPDSNTNEAASHGFVKYRIRPKTNLSLGSIIRNTAGIYFDFNAPVITNTATTEVALVSAVADAHKPQLQVYPNPNKGSFVVQLQGVQEQSVKAELRNVLGQVVWQQNLAAENRKVQQQVNTSNLSKGIYLLQVSTGKGNIVQKVVIE